ncbi:uncharacterized protein LOC131949472 [Physella acuta]|uniref:uncharacterized protein LOC131949472 n=1 Tax=Physella acuta TaxID=109671 RepID=UPI0027DEA317|nr:uncharacterized protein LOC131949472 [Physella acuta]
MDCIRNSFWILFSIIILIDAAPPTLEELTELKCNSEKPFKCLPYGVCYNADEFCHAGTVESCFPTNVTTDQLENWCKTTGQFRPEFMRDPKLCALACQARFPSLNLSNAVDHLVKIKCPHDRPFKCLPDGICHGFDEYCHAGQNKSCLDVTMSVDELKQWCQVKGQSDVTAMPDPACKFACQAKFPSLHHEGGGNAVWLYLSIGLVVLITAAMGYLVWMSREKIHSRFCKKKTAGNALPGGPEGENNANNANLEQGEREGMIQKTEGDIAKGQNRALNSAARKTEEVVIDLEPIVEANPLLIREKPDEEADANAKHDQEV